MTDKVIYEGDAVKVVETTLAKIFPGQGYEGGGTILAAVWKSTGPFPVPEIMDVVATDNPAGMRATMEHVIEELRAARDALAAR